jgi:hypothetical protein
MSSGWLTVASSYPIFMMPQRMHLEMVRPVRLSVPHHTQRCGGHCDWAEAPKGAATKASRAAGLQGMTGGAWA